MRFLWFWSFWSWSTESFRAGMLRRRPLEAIASNWDEWYHHEACPVQRETIEQLAGDEMGQLALRRWLVDVWAVEVVANGNACVPGFVIAELSRVKPFSDWPAWSAASDEQSDGGVAALILAEGSAGTSADVRPIRAVVLPGDRSPEGGSISAQDFHTDAAELEAVRKATVGALSGSGFRRGMRQWLWRGERPLPAWLRWALRLAWLSVAGLLAFLLFGPDPGDNLPWLSGIAVAAWLLLVVVALTLAGIALWDARQTGRKLAERLRNDHLQLSMPGRLTVKGGSAGLAFCCSLLRGLDRAYPNETRRSWYWRRLFARLEDAGNNWAATGVVMADGRITPVAIDEKIRACIDHRGIQGVLTPAQPGARRAQVEQVARQLRAAATSAARSPALPHEEIAYAAESPRIRLHRCRHVSDAFAWLGHWCSMPQAVFGAFAAALSVVMIAALPDFRCILLPPPPPAAVAPSSPSPYFLWVSLATRHPDFFQVVLESPVWVNRRSDVIARNSAPASTRAEIRLVRAAPRNIRDLEQGIVWIERRPHLLFRNYAPGERVGRYSISYLLRFGYE